jgi:hypothetical protein
MNVCLYSKFASRKHFALCVNFQELLLHTTQICSVPTIVMGFLSHKLNYIALSVSHIYNQKLLLKIN